MQSVFGFLNINKPAGCTSHDVVARLRKSLDIKKVGHSGTLDPFATGVLVIGINDATRLLEYLPQDKVYLAEITFGIETDTNDITGNVLHKSDLTISADNIQEKIKLFIGKTKQKPPIFSAVKIAGDRAYSLARKNKINLGKMPEKDIEIYSIEILSYTFPVSKLKVHCSSGTYIRSLARDLGYKLNTYAVLSSLKRINTGNCFTYENSISPELINRNTLCEFLLPAQSILSFKRLYLDVGQINDIACGKHIKVQKNQNFEINNRFQMIDDKNNLIGIGQSVDGNIIKPLKVFLKRDGYLSYA